MPINSPSKRYLRRLLYVTCFGILYFPLRLRAGVIPSRVLGRPLMRRRVPPPGHGHGERGRHLDPAGPRLRGPDLVSLADDPRRQAERRHDQPRRPGRDQPHVALHDDEDHGRPRPAPRSGAAADRRWSPTSLPVLLRAPDDASETASSRRRDFPPPRRPSAACCPTRTSTTSRGRQGLDPAGRHLPVTWADSLIGGG